MSRPSSAAVDRVRSPPAALDAGLAAAAGVVLAAGVDLPAGLVVAPVDLVPADPEPVDLTPAGLAGPRLPGPGFPFGLPVTVRPPRPGSAVRGSGARRCPALQPAQRHGRDRAPPRPPGARWSAEPSATSVGCPRRLPRRPRE